MTDHFPFRLRGLRLATSVLAAGLLCSGALHAQSLRPSGQLNLLRAQPATPGPRTVDYIVALVNSEPVTNNEVRQRLVRVEQQLTQQGAALPPRDELARQVLEQLVSERAQIQQAKELGIRVDEATLLQAEQAIATQNQLSLEDFRRRLAAEGMDSNRLRNELSNQILLQRVREREVQARVQVTESDIDDYIREQRSSTAISDLQLNMAHVLVLVPEGADTARVTELQARAQQVADRARAGGDFAALAREFSDAPEKVNGGEFGLRPADRLPGLFVEATRALRPGEIAGPVRSPAGFHVLKLLEKRQAGLPDVIVTQTRARHILLRVSPSLTAQVAAERLGQYRQQIVSGAASFPNLAREHSQDGSAREGGDLGWASPGQFVPEFEEVMNSLKPGEISQPLVSRFGVHLIQVTERRDQQLSQREQREIVRGLLREKKSDEALSTWLQEVRGRAFVEYREAPSV
ncbi:peptidylprolyl isomerase [Hydrogenophaga sp.]|uniref:peptidylprolyl isomerase n=1 Tax=Hydrogenophaga sp. TaxID=1904254 RepID=UPI0025BEBED4|nr:peptidylprolyl isomerase [Hydrogenophaga sp.]